MGIILEQKLRHTLLHRHIENHFILLLQSINLLDPIPKRFLTQYRLNNLNRLGKFILANRINPSRFLCTYCFRSVQIVY